MRVIPAPSLPGRTGAAQSAQATCRVASHQSSPTSQPVGPVTAIPNDTSTRRPSQYTFDISV